ncbi:MAG: META domain-containing protein [Filimonas sp.]|nr:META domain-containing protein [Filimonas sp.]
MKKLLSVLALGALIIACNNNSTPNASTNSDSLSARTTTALATDLFGKDWKLLELNNQAIKLDTTFKKEPFLTFDKQTGRLNGNAGCNNFMATFKLKEKDSIDISLGGATLMACPNLAIENQFLNLLKEVKTYHIDGNTLFLENGDKKGMIKLATK